MAPVAISPPILFALNWVRHSWIGEMMAGSGYLYTLGLMLHFTGMAILFGAMLIIDLRLLGITKQIPLKTVLSFLPWAIGGFILNAFTGYLFFTFRSVEFYVNPAFEVKMILVLIAGLNALWFTLFEEKKLKALPPYADTTIAIKISAGLSLTLWTLVIIAGRMIVGFANLHL